jgi:protein-disulfide isomerase
VPKLSAGKTALSLRQSLNSLKADENVFAALLQQQPRYETDDCDSVIRFGNPDGKLRLTVLSNPYCNPCARMHTRIEELLRQTNNGISVRYILSSFKEELNPTSKHLIAACMDAKGGTVMQILSGWFEKGKTQKDDFFKDYALDMDNPQIEAEFRKHEAWKQKTRLRSTPTVLVNGYQLPDSYKVEDLRCKPVLRLCGKWKKTLLLKIDF